MGLVADRLRPAASQEPVCLRVRCLQIAPNLPCRHPADLETMTSTRGTSYCSRGEPQMERQSCSSFCGDRLIFIIIIYILGIGMYWPTIKLASCGNRKRNLGHSVIRAAGFEDHAQRIAEVMQTWS